MKTTTIFIMVFVAAFGAMDHIQRAERQGWKTATLTRNFQRPVSTILRNIGLIISRPTVLGRKKRGVLGTFIKLKNLRPKLPIKVVTDYAGPALPKTKVPKSSIFKLLKIAKCFGKH
jgi:hypothetical protein